jgi:uncharacterized phiE125 gp8 family phage protein
MRREMNLLETVTAPASSGVSLAALKEHLRITHTAEDPRLEDLLAAAEEYVAATYGIRLLAGTYRASWNRFPVSSILLPVRPVTSITSVIYDPADGGAEATVDASVYGLSAYSSPPRIYLNAGQSWPGAIDLPASVRVVFVAGWTDRPSIPPTVTRAVKLLAAHFYERSEAYEVAAGGGLVEVPGGVESLLSAHRIAMFTRFA